MLGTQAPGADIYPPPLSILDDCSRPDIGQPAPLRMTVGVRYIMSKLWALTANLALQRVLLFD